MYVLRLAAIGHVHDVHHAGKGGEIIGQDEEALKNLAALLILLWSPVELDMQTHDTLLGASNQLCFIAHNCNFMIVHDGKDIVPVAYVHFEVSISPYGAYMKL